MYELILFLTLLALGFGVGQYLETLHYKSIIHRESSLRHIPAIATKHLPRDFTPCSTKMVCGNVVISIDFFKKFVSGMRSIVGGRISSYETLIDRARREAILRMKKQAACQGANYVFNVKMETSSISKGRRDSIGSVEVLAYGTAIIKSKSTNKHNNLIN